MGACGSKVGPADGVGAAVDVKKIKKMDKKLDEVMKLEAEQEQLEIKLLLLGAGESGKTTFRKQMRIIHSTSESKFTDEEVQGYRINIYKNIFDGINFLISACAMHGEELDSHLQEIADELEVISPDDDEPETYDEVLADCVKTMWFSDPIQNIIKKANELKLSNVNVSIDSLHYYMSNIKRICSPSFVPTKQDILQARSQTILVEEETFEYLKTMFRIIDVGGQRNERKKWLPLFEKVTAFMFFASLVEYDQTLAEAKEENRMKESLQIFGAVTNYHFIDTPPPIILFLNKKDLFDAKAVVTDLSVCFAEYTGGLDTRNALEYIKMKYLEQNHGKRKIYCFATCATDTNNINHVFKACSDIILKENLKVSGMYTASGEGGDATEGML